MKKMILLGLILTAGLLFISCEDSGGGDDDDPGDAASLGNTLNFSGSVNRTFTVATQNWATTADVYTDDFILNDESDDTVYASQDNGGGETAISMSYSGTTHEAHLYSTSGWTGVETSDANVQMTTVQIEVDGTSDEVAFCEYDTATPKLRWYYYLYATGEVVLDGTFVDTDETPNENHTFNNIRFFEGWNQVIKETSDGVSYDYVTGTLSAGNWCYMDNP